MDQNASYYGDRPRARPRCVRRGPSSLRPHRKGHSSPHVSAHVYCSQTVAHLSNLLRYTVVQTDSHTDIQARTLIAVLRTSVGGELSNHSWRPHIWHCMVEQKWLVSSSHLKSAIHTYQRSHCSQAHTNYQNHKHISVPMADTKGHMQFQVISFHIKTISYT